MSRLQEFYAANPEQAPRAPVEAAARGARTYGTRAGYYDPSIDPSAYTHTEVNPRRGLAIGRAYLNAPEYDPRAVPAFRQFREETGRQFEFMTGRRGGGLGLDFEVTKQDPYAGPHEMMQDVAGGRIKALSTAVTGGHPFLTDEENDMFRAVHDVFGHAATGSGFSRHGEEAAWQHHSQMYSPLARRAMTTETRGQNSAFIFSLGGQQFSPQKVALLPSQYSELPGRRSRGILQGRQFTL